MGLVHAANATALPTCRVAALVDSNRERLTRASEICGGATALFTSVEELAEAGVCDATFVVTPTEHHRRHATALLHAGHRVLLEKPLTGTLEGDRDFAEELKRDYPGSLMIAFQRRFTDTRAMAFYPICRFTMWTKSCG
jgi:predicted dehydrogenase